MKKLTKGLALLLSILMLCMALPLSGAVTVSAATYGDLTYTVSNGEVTITDCAATASGEVVVPSEIDGYPVTSIGSAAFSDCTSITSLVIPDGVTSLGTYAVQRCSALTSVTIPASVTSIGSNAFRNNTALTAVYISDLKSWIEITFSGTYANPLYFAKKLYLNNKLVSGNLVIPEGVESIGAYTLLNCTDITSVTIPSSVVSSGTHAFFGCSSINAVYITDLGAWCEISYGNIYATPSVYTDNIYLNNELLSGDVVIPEGTEKINIYAFYKNTHITGITIPDSVNSIGEDAFYNCSSLTNVSTGNGVSSIGGNAFYKCLKMQNITVGSAVKSIGEKAFSMCSALENVYYTGTEEKWGNITIEASNDSLTSAQITYNYGADVDQENVGTYEISPGDLNADGNFNANDLAIMKQVIIEENKDENVIEATDCNGDYNTNIIDLVRFKRHMADKVNKDNFIYEIVDGEAIITGFDGTPKGAVTVPASIDGYRVTAVADDAFKDSSEITSVLFPSSVTSIGASAFENCASLKSVALPDSIDYIGARAFYNCGKMFAIKLSENITALADDIFNSCLLLSVIEIPENVEEIGQGAFASCCSLVEINVPEKVTVLNDNTFSGCSELIFIGLPENLKEIKCYTFYGCEKLESVTIPITVVMVGDNAFASCSSLLSVVVPYETAFGNNVFTGCSVLVVKGFGSTGSMDAAVNSGVKYETMECGHSEYVLLNAVNPTCLNTGFSGDKYCVNCGKIEAKGVELAKTAHIEEIINQREPTCTKYGYTGDTVCKVCSELIESGRSTYRLLHSGVGLTEYIAPTCTEDGIYKGAFTCEHCGEYIENLTVSKLGHSGSYSSNVVHANCVEEGYSGDWYCTRCDELVKQGEVTAAGECYYVYTNYKDATCTEDGYTGDLACTGCDTVTTKGEIIPALGHLPVTDNYKAATCTENGYSGDSTCSRCYETLSQGQVLPLLGHISVLINYKAATCLEDGYSGDQICSVCQVFVSTGKTLEKTGHSPVLQNQKDYTDTESGYTGDLVCEHCGEVIEEGKVIPANHQHSMKTDNKKDATCKEEGYTGDSVCEECGYSVAGEVIEKLEHETTQSTVEPTCTESGYVLDECNNCDYEYKHDETEALGHDWDADWTVDSELGCTQDSKKHKNCSRCDEVLEETVEATGHSWGELTGVKEATCTENGYTGDRVCESCGETEYGDIILSSGHTYSEWSIRCYHSSDNAGDMSGGLDGEITEEYAEEYRNCSACGYEEVNRIDETLYDTQHIGGGCETDSYIEYNCRYCDYSYTADYVTATGHNYTVSSSTSPTCTSAGETTYCCGNCGNIYTETYSEPTGHSWGELTGVKEATCTENGYTGDRVCESCGETEYGDIILSSGHTYSEWSIRCYHSSDNAGDMSGGLDGEITEEYAEEYRNCSACGYEEVNRIDETLYDTQHIGGGCETDSYTEYRCRYCDYSYTADYVTATGHNYTVSSSTSPTCTSAGETTYCCGNCGNTYTETYSEPTGHSWGELTGAKEATCTENGYTGDRVCESCGETEYGETIEATGHTLENGTCTVCGEVIEVQSTVIESDHPYSSNENETWTVTYEGASALSVTFTTDTQTESGYDFIYLYDAEDNLIGKYSGTELSAVTLEIDGDTLKIVLTSDGSVQKNGFTAEVKPLVRYCSCGAVLGVFEVETEASCSNEGVKSAVCSVCGEKATKTIPLNSNHDWSNADGWCSNCGEQCMHENGYSICDTCGKMQCVFCGSYDHYDYECPNSSGGGDVYCDACGGYGHMAGDPSCPNSGGGGDMYCSDCGDYGHTTGDPSCPNLGGSEGIS